MNNIIVRYAKRDELECVNKMRAEVNELHVNGRPDIFRPGFRTELQQRIYEVLIAHSSHLSTSLRCNPEPDHIL